MDSSKAEPAAPPQVALNDEDLLVLLGYKQEFKRDFSGLELFGLSFSITGVVQSIAIVLLFSLPYGRMVGMVWGWFTCYWFNIFVALAMAELGSAAPTAGGLYYWTFKFSSPKYRRLMSWFIGYFNTAEYIAGMAGGDWGIATQIMAAAKIGSDGQFVATDAQVYGVFCAIPVSHAIMSSLATKVIARLQRFVFLVVMITLPAATPKELHNSASFAFGHFKNTSGWTNGYAFIIMSFLAPAWTVAGFDTSVHISEEARNAPRALPFGMLSSTILSCILGWIVTIVLAFYIGNDLHSVIGNPIGQPMATIFFNSVGKQGTFAIWTFMILTLWMGDAIQLIAGSRQLLAFSRDQGFPLSVCVLQESDICFPPLKHCVIFLAFMALLLGLLSFAGPLAISTVFTMSIVCQYVGFATPIIARWVGGHKFTPGPFNLGLMSAPVAFVASMYMIFMIVVFMFPATPDPTSQSMNYTVVILGGTLMLSLGYYFFPKYGGRNWFIGPVKTIRDLDPANDEKLKHSSSLEAMET
ncbi:amino acid/polyamine transporter I [Mycena olivaceomarginata]|nr:amino acid/polyamine transporter I [Mycena olivaceomarginata]